MATLLDLWHSLVSIFMTGDWIALAIMAVIALAAGVAMRNMGSLVTATFGSLVLFTLAIYLRAVFTDGGKNASDLARNDWHALLGLTVHTVLVYAIAFALTISVVHAVRSLIARA